jgi:16S rRNA (cytosine967-C5)-methyltransferase
MPAWLLSRWQRAYGTEAAARIARSFLVPPDKFVRIVGDPPPGINLEPTAVPGCFRVAGGSTGGLRFQDIGSQAIVPLLDLRPGLTLLDLCAAPGGKTAQALEHGVRVVACDIHLNRLRELRDFPCDLVVLDGTRSLPFGRGFDRILVDAPCSGTGTLGRNPEIRWRIQEKDLTDLHVKQVALLRSALDMLAPGGLLVYSTCSLESEENEDVIAEAADGRAARLWRRLPGRDPGDGFFAAVIPSDLNSANG